MSGHTAEAIVDRPVADMANVAKQVMRDDGVSITETRSQDSGAQRIFEGEKGDLDVTVTIQRTRALLAKIIR